MLAGKIHKLARRVGLVAPRIPKSNGFSDEMPGEQNMQGAQSPDAAACHRQDLFCQRSFKTHSDLMCHGRDSSVKINFGFENIQTVL